MKYLFILNDSPYGTQRTYSALRLVRALATDHAKVAIFLLGDGVVSGLRRQSPADASYNVQEMLRMIIGQTVAIAACRTCLEARGIDDQSLVESVQCRTMDDLRDWTEEAEKCWFFSVIPVLQLSSRPRASARVEGPAFTHIREKRHSAVKLNERCYQHAAGPAPLLRLHSRQQVAGSVCRNHQPSVGARSRTPQCRVRRIHQRVQSTSAGLLRVL